MSSYNIPNTYTVNLSPTSSSVYSIGAQGGTSASIYTSPMYNGSTWTTASATIAPMTVDQRGQIELKGDNADIKINGKSLKEAIENIEQRLNLLTVNVELEAEWSELRELGERYRALEKEIKVKMKTWDILKNQD